MKKYLMLASICLFFGSHNLYAEQFNNAFKHKFWTNLYANGGSTLYCNVGFTNKDILKPGMADPKLSLTHIYPGSAMKNFIGCESRVKCRSSSSLFNQLETDPHNIWPSTDHASKVRGDSDYGENPIAQTCEYRDKQKDEFIPLPQARGRIARSLLHMFTTWNLPIDYEEMLLIYKWHKEYPVTDEERQRNEAIFKVWGTRNEWIDGSIDLNVSHEMTYQ